MPRYEQPRLRFRLTEYFGKAKTATGDVWWYDDLQDDGTTRRVPLIPINPVASAPPQTK
jgi:hypothetical protein